MGSFPAHDHSHPGRPPGRGQITEQPAQLGNIRAVAQAAVGVDGRGPRLFRESQDRRLHGRGHGEPDRELQVHPGLAVSAQTLQPRPGGARAVSGNQDRDPVPVRIGDLGKRQIGHRDVVGSGVRTGVARSQDRGQSFVGVVQPRGQRENVGAACSFSE
jgi:hypothetical protein